MRNILMMLIAIALVASSGCGEKSDAKRVAKGPRGGDGSTRTRAPSPAAGGPTAPADEEKKSDTSDDAGADKKEDPDAEKDAAAKKAAARAKAKNAPRYKHGRRVAPRPSAGNSPAVDDESEEIPETKEEEKAEEEKQDDSDNDVVQDEPEEEKDDFVSFLDRARAAFGKGHDPEGFQYLYAYALTEEDALSNYPMGWYDGISEPRLGLRWGVGIDYNPGSFDGDPPTIGDPIEKTGRSRSSGGGGGGDDFGLAGGNSGAGAQGLGAPRSSKRGNRSSGDSSNRRTARERDAKPPAEELEYYTGDFGTKLVDRYEMRRRHNDAYYGTLLRDISESSASEEDEAPKADERKKRSSSANDDFEIIGSGSTVTPPANRGNRRDRDRDKGDGYEADKTMLAPGLMMLGVGERAEMLERAKSLGLDVLVMYVVKVKHSERRNNETSTKTNTQIKVISVKSGEEMASTKSLSNVAVANARDSNRDDPVEVELDKIFSDMADEKLRARELPDYDADTYRKRFEFLMKSEYDNPLPVLVEVKSYLDAGFINDNDYQSAVEQLLGEVEALDLIDGDMRKKEFALRRYLPGQYDFSVAGDDSNFR